MFLKFTRRPLAIRKDDYRRAKGSLEHLPDTKYERKFRALARPNTIEVIRRYALDFEIAESYRNEDGKERGRIVLYLASIREEHLKSSAHRECFWRRIDAKLSGVTIAPQDEKKIRSDLQKHVPKS